MEVGSMSVETRSAAEVVPRNPGTEWCRWISVLVAAQPAVVDGKPLADHMEKANL
jgi:hypothetical protein